MNSLKFRNYMYRPIEFHKSVAINGPDTRMERHFNGVDFINLKDKVDLSKIYQHLSSVEQPSAYTSGFTFSEAISSINDTFFVIHSELKLESALYKKVRKNDVWLKVKTSLQLLGLGKSTLLFQMAVRDTSDDELLLSTLVKLAKVDSIARRSSNFPESFMEKFSELVKTGTSQLPMFRPLKAPHNSFGHQFVIRPSDTDSNGHTSNFVYTELCLDCAHLAATKSDYFKWFTGDFDQPKMVERYFAKECGEGDTVKVVVWEDVDSTTVLHFQIYKDDVILFHANFNFYSKNHTLSKL